MLFHSMFLCFEIIKEKSYNCVVLSKSAHFYKYATVSGAFHVVDDREMGCNCRSLDIYYRQRSCCSNIQAKPSGIGNDMIAIDLFIL